MKIEKPSMGTPDTVVSAHPGAIIEEVTLPKQYKSAERFRTLKVRVHVLAALAVAFALTFWIPDDAPVKQADAFSERWNECIDALPTAARSHHAASSCWSIVKLREKADTRRLTRRALTRSSTSKQRKADLSSLIPQRDTFSLRWNECIDSLPTAVLSHHASSICWTALRLRDANARLQKEERDHQGY